MFSNFTEETCTGTDGDLLLLGATDNRISFGGSFADGASVAYVVEDADGSKKCSGIGVYNSSANSIVRNDDWTFNGSQVTENPLNDLTLKLVEELTVDRSQGYLFINPRTGTRLKGIHKGWNRLRNDAGLPHLRLHDLRHQYASFLVNSGRTLYEVQQILGHSDPMVTQRYAHLSSKSLQAAAASASNAITEAMQVAS